VRVADIRIRVVKGGVDRIHEQPIQPGKSFHEILLEKPRNLITRLPSCVFRKKNLLDYF